jgi:hypothetical protein
MKIIAFTATLICTLIVLGQLDPAIMIFDQSYQLVAALIAGAGLAYVAAMS